MCVHALGIITQCVTKGASVGTLYVQGKVRIIMCMYAVRLAHMYYTHTHNSACDTAN